MASTKDARQPAEDRIQISVHRDMINPGRIDLLKELYSDLNAALRPDMLYHYSGTISSLHWIALCQNREYGHIELVELIDRSFPEVARIMKANMPKAVSMNLVSLGPGDGETDIRILRHLETAFDFRCYYCIDFSFELLRHAVFRVSSAKVLKNGFRIKAVCGNFAESSDLLVCEEGARLFALTGFTLGNYNEINLLGKIRTLMTDRDFLLVDARLHDLKNWDGQSPIALGEISHLLNSYAQEQTDHFVFGPVEAVTLASVADVTFGRRINRETTCVPKALNVTLCCNGLRTKMRFTGEPVERAHLDLATTTFYSYTDLRRWLPDAGFNCIWDQQEDRVGLFLLTRSGGR